MQLRNRCAGGLQLAGGSRLPSRAGRRAVQPQATAKESKADVRAARMARILRQYEAAGAPVAVAAVAAPLPVPSHVLACLQAAVACGGPTRIVTSTCSGTVNACCRLPLL